MNYKNTARQFLELIIAGQIDEAYDTYVNMNGKHHNPYFPAGFAALREAMKENHDKFPDKIFSIKHLVGDGNMVAAHSHLKFNEDDKGMAVVHIFRFGGEKIEEMWDCGMALPADLPNADGAF